MSDFLAWIYWNPPRHLFKLPYLDHPITYYGLFFVAGFIISYFIVAYLFQQKLNKINVIRAQDIQNWPVLIDRLQAIHNNPSHPLYPCMQKFENAGLKGLQCYQEPTKKQKSAIISLLNEALLSFSRKNLEAALSPALVSVSQLSFLLTDRLTWFVVLGTIIGARLCDVFFYDWPYFKNHPLEIFMVWKGGLASHGGVVGVLAAVYLYYRFILKSVVSISFIELMDIMVVPSGLAAFFIRVGNFFNQEILGPPTTLPWGIIFGDPVDYYTPLPRHPTQLYEAFIYIAIFSVILFLWKKWENKVKPGIISGIFFIAVFGSRFFIEFIKAPQSQMIDESFLMMGQYLSIPFVFLGIGLIFLSRKLYGQNTLAHKN